LIGINLTTRTHNETDIIKGKHPINKFNLKLIRLAGD